MTKAKKDELDLALRATWLYLVGDLTQIEVAEQLGITKLKAHRLIQATMRSGVVKVFVEGDIAECLKWEHRLMERYGLSYCRVAPCVDTEPLPLKTLGSAGAQYLNALLDRPGEMLIGLGHGRTLAAMAENLPKREVDGKRFVSLLGGLGKRFVANPFDVIHLLAGKTGAEAFVLPIPLVSNSAEDKRVLTAQQEVNEIFSMMAQADMMIVGIGSAMPTSYFARHSVLSEAELAEIRALGGKGEMLGRFFSEDGAMIHTPMLERIIAFDWRSTTQPHVVALAGGTRKIEAIRAVSRSGFLSGLITDDRTAKALLNDEPN